jgi:DNA-binding MarR family transcriptional regulator
MNGVSSEPVSIDLTNPYDLQHAVRVGTAWIELRRGATAGALRDYLYGSLECPLMQGQMDALDLLVRRDRAMSALADRLRIDPSSATRAVQRLVDDGLAERYPSPEDRRIVMIRATPEGGKVHREVSARRSAVLERILNKFEPDERATLADYLARFVSAIDEVVDDLT